MSDRWCKKTTMKVQYPRFWEIVLKVTVTLNHGVKMKVTKKTDKMNEMDRKLFMKVTTLLYPHKKTANFSVNQTLNFKDN
jgi:hypothetical protein